MKMANLPDTEYRSGTGATTLKAFSKRGIVDLLHQPDICVNIYFQSSSTLNIKTLGWIHLEII